MRTTWMDTTSGWVRSNFFVFNDDPAAALVRMHAPVTALSFHTRR